MGTEIVAVYGKCDGVEIAFTKNTKNNRWECNVPADFNDGTYVVELFAEDLAGNVGYYTGKLYMCDSRFIKLEIDKSDYIVGFSCDFNVTFKMMI